MAEITYQYMFLDANNWVSFNIVLNNKIHKLYFETHGHVFTALILTNEQFSKF